VPVPEGDLPDDPAAVVEQDRPRGGDLPGEADVPEHEPPDAPPGRVDALQPGALDQGAVVEPDRRPQAAELARRERERQAAIRQLADANLWLIEALEAFAGDDPREWEKHENRDRYLAEQLAEQLRGGHRPQDLPAQVLGQARRLYAAQVGGDGHGPGYLRALEEFDRRISEAQPPGES
jgi:hypothetical protein